MPVLAIVVKSCYNDTGSSRKLLNDAGKGWLLTAALSLVGLRNTRNKVYSRGKKLVRTQEGYQCGGFL